MPRGDWRDRTSCICGKSFKVGAYAEMKHRHNFPAMCNARGLAKWRKENPE